MWDATTWPCCLAGSKTWCDCSCQRFAQHLPGSAQLRSSPKLRLSFQVGSSKPTTFKLPSEWQALHLNIGFPPHSRPERGGICKQQPRLRGAAPPAEGGVVVFAASSASLRPAMDWKSTVQVGLRSWSVPKLAGCVLFAAAQISQFRPDSKTRGN